MDLPEDEREENQSAVEKNAAIDNTDELLVLKTRLHRSLKHLDNGLLKLIFRRFGLDGQTPMSSSEFAQNSGLTVEEVEVIEAEALRALMGYGPLVKKKDSNQVEH